MKNFMEYNFDSLIKDITDYGLDYQSKMITQFGFSRYTSMADLKSPVFSEIDVIKGKKVIPEIKLGLTINSLPEGVKQLCLTFLSEYSPRRNKFSGNILIYRAGLASVFSSLGITGGTRLSLMEKTRCWINVSAELSEYLPDIIWKIYTDVMALPGRVAYDMFGDKPTEMTSDLPDLTFPELDSL
jgi:hypothetical protein